MHGLISMLLHSFFSSTWMQLDVALDSQTASWLQPADSLFSISLWVAPTAAEDTDSYTKEETKSSKFINLTHAASMSRQLSQSNILGSAATPANTNGRLQGQPSTDQLPSPLTPQVLEHKDGILHSGAAASSADLGTPPWVGSPPGSSWLAKAASMSANVSAGLPSAPPPATPTLPSAADGEVPL